MTVKEIFKAHYEETKDWCSDEKTKFEWAADYIFDLITYDGYLDELFVKHIIDVLKIIRDSSNFEYIKDESNYIKYILVCNLLDKFHWIEWGTSIRGAWFENYHPNCKVHPILEELEWLTYDFEKKEHVSHKIAEVQFTKENIIALIEFLEE